MFAAAKAFKAWAIASLGTRWTYRVFVLPGEQLVMKGPYRWLRHPNYLGVMAELLGFALLAGARWSGIIAVLSFGALLRRRIRSEEDALGLSR
jgi:methyltransferase